MLLGARLSELQKGMFAESGLTPLTHAKTIIATLQALRHSNFFGSRLRRLSREFSLYARDPSRTMSAQDDVGIEFSYGVRGGSVLVFTVPAAGAVDGRGRLSSIDRIYLFRMGL